MGQKFEVFWGLEGEKF